MRLMLSILMLSVLLMPRLAFADAMSDFIKQQDEKSNAFFARQAQERGEWIKTHPDIIARLDEAGRQLMIYRDAKQQAEKEGRPFSLEPPAQVTDSEFDAFVQKQQGEKVAFLNELAQEKKAFMDNNPGVASLTPSL